MFEAVEGNAHNDVVCEPRRTFSPKLISTGGKKNYFLVDVVAWNDTPNTRQWTYVKKERHLSAKTPFVLFGPGSRTSLPATRNSRLAIASPL